MRSVSKSILTYSSAKTGSSTTTITKLHFFSPDEKVLLECAFPIMKASKIATQFHFYFARLKSILGLLKMTVFGLAENVWM